eukprot:TRINITY_DN1186_c0_g1_i1.p1 TRINITY_DN1186_c0_g1~~TRINITY_DN1186_c0_g1_i1.p1  ORF type:complete len:525 (-),score=107.46 TRINITY_DN1186_c0_g1_i1:34-1608(-)
MLRRVHGKITKSKHSKTLLRNRIIRIRTTDSTTRPQWHQIPIIRYIAMDTPQTELQHEETTMESDPKVVEIMDKLGESLKNKEADTEVYTNLLKNLNELKAFEHVMSMINLLSEHELVLGNTFYEELLYSFTKMKYAGGVMSINTTLNQSTEPWTFSTYLSLMKAYSGVSLLENAERIYYLAIRDADLEASPSIHEEMMTIFCRRMNMLSKAKEVLNMMLDRDIPVSTKTYNIILEGCAKNKDITLATSLYNDMGSSGIELDINSWNFVIDCYARSGKLVQAHKLLGKMKTRDVDPNEDTYGIIIKGFAKERLYEDMDNLFFELRETNLTPRRDTWRYVAEGSARTGKLDRAFRITDIMIDSGQNPNNIHKHILLSACKKANTIDKYVKRFGHNNETRTYQPPEKIKSSRFLIHQDGPKFKPKEWEIIDDPFSSPSERTIRKQEEKEKFKRKMKDLAKEYLSNLEESERVILENQQNKFIQSRQEERELAQYSKQLREGNLEKQRKKIDKKKAAQTNRKKLKFL